jgi:hypothetical protein
MMANEFAVFDGDSHVIEPPALWEKYLEPEYRTLGKYGLWRHEGPTGAYLKINGEIFRDKGNPNLPRHALWRPGMNWDAVGELDPHTRHPMNEGAWDPQARLADMDAMGVDQSLLYPTWFDEGFFLVRDPDVAYALAHAYNDWIADFCKAAPNRLFAAAILPLQDMDFALEELQRVARIPRRVYSAGLCRRPLHEPSLLRAAMGRARAARDHGGGARHTRPVEPRMDLARAVLREDQGPAGTAGGPWRGWRTVCRGGGREQHHLHPSNAARPSAGADPRPLARQSHVRRFDPDRFHGHGTLSGNEDRCRARQGLLDAGSTRKRWRPRPG